MVLGRYLIIMVGYLDPQGIGLWQKAAGGQILHSQP